MVTRFHETEIVKVRFKDRKRVFYLDAVFQYYERGYRHAWVKFYGPSDTRVLLPSVRIFKAEEK